MNYLFINTATAGQINLAVFDEEKKIDSQMIEVEYEYSEKLITEIDTLLSKSEISLKDIAAIIVVQGPGRFSALRTGVTTANTLAWSLNIPVVGIALDDISDTSIQKTISSITEKTFTQPIIPEYGQEPNISKPKK